ncbi:MAG: hypothetical protein KF747_01650 [Nitrospira sp.]|nr:hypothetical protein [Nitrospira sp.]
MFEHEYFDVYPFESVPLDRDCYLMDESYIQEYEASILDVFAGKGGDPIGEISFVAARKVNEHSLDLSWYPNTFSRFHEMVISLPRSQFVTCIGCWRYDEKPHIFVKSGWLEQLHLKSYTVFCMVDAIGVKAALQNGTLSREKLILLREAIDRLAENHSEVCFVSFADSLLIKRNWTVGHFRSNVSYTYNPEVFVHIIKELQAVYQEVLGLDVYAILTQGTNEYYEDSLVHISDGKNHVSLNSLGIPFAQLMAIDTSVRAAIRAKEHGRFDLYLDEHFYNSLRFRFEFDKRARPKYPYSAPMMDVGNHYYCAQLQEVLKNLQLDEKTKQADAQEC